LGIVALVLGIIGVNQIDASGGRLEGKTQARIGYILGIISIALMILLLLLMLLLVPTLGAARKTARQMQNSTQVRGIHSGCVLYAQGNNTYFPGLDVNGDPDAGNQSLQTRTADRAISTAGRFQILLKNNFFTGEYAISPAETKTTWQGGRVSEANYSFAMLDISGNNAKGLAEERASEWRDTINSEAAVISDRLAGGTPGQNNTYRSIHTRQNGQGWRGSVGWNDNHVSWETLAILQTTRYGPGDVNSGDDLFVDTTGGSDALMTYSSK
jgi:uncharacterized membrane protein